MEPYARRLFGAAALFNFAVAASLLFARDRMQSLLSLDLIAGSNLQIANVAAALIAVFGYAYWRAALDPRRYRAYIELGAIGKLAVVPAVAVPWFQHAAGWQLPALALGDLAFAILFVQYLRSRRSHF
ncbi:MAG: hypothetical protein WC809_05000 [Sinimarinibacterium sp.]|jgi:hypothetical protein